MIGFEDLRDCDTSVFDENAAAWRGLADQLTDRGLEIATALAGLDGWTGSAADAAKAEFAGHRRNITDMATTIGRIPGVLTGFADQIRELQPRLGAIVTEAGSVGCRIHADGSVSYEPDLVHRAPQGAEDLGPTAARLYQARIADLVGQARAADEHAATELGTLTAEAAGFAPATDPTTTAAAATIPPPGTSPKGVRKWWDSLTDRQREALLFTRPGQLGRLDGLPSAIRDRANRAQLAEQKGRLEAERERLAALLGPGQTDARLDQINKALTGIAALEQRLYHPMPGQQPSFLLGFDSAGNGRAVVAIGDPDTATNVATYVPGTGASLGTVGGDLRRSDHLVQAAQNAGSPSTSVITWDGYDAPQDIFPQAAGDRFADGAKADLDRFEDGLRAAHVGPRAHNTVIAHSYGTTVVGHAARDGDLNADDVVFVASPGVGVTHADQLHLDGVPQNQVGQHIHSTVALHDPINLAAGVNGPAPTGPGFGGTTFESNPGQAGPWYELGWDADVHSRYWDYGNKALANMGLVIAGKPTF